MYFNPMPTVPPSMIATQMWTGGAGATPQSIRDPEAGGESGVSNDEGVEESSNGRRATHDTVIGDLALAIKKEKTLSKWDYRRFIPAADERKQIIGDRFI